MQDAHSITAFARARLKRSALRLFSVATRTNDRTKQVLLTFDDGPDPYVTPAVLERLSNYRARAVFFVVGNRISRGPGVLEQISARGHLIGNHSHTHDPDLPYRSYLRDLALCQREVYRATGTHPVLFRPAGGKITLSAVLAARRLDLRVVLWSMDHQDWRLRDRAIAEETGRTMGRLASSGDILLLHDDNPCVLNILDELLPRLVERDFDLGTACSSLESSFTQTRNHLRDSG